MPTPQQTSNETAIWDDMPRALVRAKNIIRSILVWLCVGIFILVEWHLIPEEVLRNKIIERVAVSIFVLFGASVVELLFDIRRATHDTKRKVGDLLNRSEAQTESLIASTTELAGYLKNLGKDDHVLMEHIGLNLQQSWNYLRDQFLDLPNLKHVDLRLLMLPGSADEIKMNARHPIPRDVVDWCKSTDLKIRQIGVFLEDERASFAAQGRHLKITIKQYCVLPVVHGFSVTTGKTRIHYVSFCRWRASSAPPELWAYDWGENRYHRIFSQDRENSIADIGRVFDGHFNYLWASSGDPALQYYSDAPVSPKEIPS